MDSRPWTIRLSGDCPERFVVGARQSCSIRLDISLDQPGPARTGLELQSHCLGRKCGHVPVPDGAAIGALRRVGNMEFVLARSFAGMWQRGCCIGSSMADPAVLTTWPRCAVSSSTELRSNSIRLSTQFHSGSHPDRWNHDRAERSRLSGPGGSQCEAPLLLRNL